MDSGRRLTLFALAAAGCCGLAACAHREAGPSPAPAAASPPAAIASPAAAADPSGPRRGPIPYLEAWGPPPASAARAALRAHVAARAVAREPAAPEADPVGDRVEGAMRIFGYRPGRTYPVRAAPFRVTTLELEAGETITELAAGDTVRWQIGETRSGSGSSLRSLVLIKPLTAGLSTNLVLSTSRRVYLVDLASVPRDFDPAVAWSYPAPPEARSPEAGIADVSDRRYGVEAASRPPAWTPHAVFDDGTRTYILFPPGLERTRAPILRVDGVDGRPALVNYRQNGAMFVVDGLFAKAELRDGDRRASIVRIRRLDPEDRR